MRHGLAVNSSEGMHRTYQISHSQTRHCLQASVLCCAGRTCHRGLMKNGWIGNLVAPGILMHLHLHLLQLQLPRPPHRGLLAW